MSKHVDPKTESRENQIERLREALRLGVDQAERGELRELNSEDFKQAARARLEKLIQEEKN